MLGAVSTAAPGALRRAREPENCLCRPPQHRSLRSRGLPLIQFRRPVVKDAAG